jgi:hypothetical protein
MIALYSDEELRTALNEAKRRSVTASKPASVSKQMQAQHQDGHAAEADAYYARLRLEAAHRWGLVR